MEVSQSTKIWKHYAFHTCLIIFILFIGYANGVAECMSGNKVKCFECNSYDDPRCADPFNWTTIPPRKLCEGCCVKIVQGIDTPERKVRRGCTDDLEINLFIVDHVCMSEGGGKGRMCFCEENECNHASIPTSKNFNWIQTLLLVPYSIAFTKVR